MAREQLIIKNLNLVHAIVKRISNFYLPREDLIQYGIIGLIKALDNYDKKKGVRFSTYAVHWIKGEIYLGISTFLGIPRSVREKWRDIKDAHDTIMKNEKAIPKIEDISKKLGMDKGKVTDALINLSFFFPDHIEDLAENGYEPVSEWDNKQGSDDLLLEMNYFLNKLSSLEKEIMVFRYWEGKTFREIAGQLGKEENAVKQTHHRAVTKIRKLQKDISI